MKKFVFLLIVLLFVASVNGCNSDLNSVQIAATTMPVYNFSTALCEGTGISVGRLVTENVSCLHDYTLQVSQMRMMETADMIIISGAGLESFLSDISLGETTVIDASTGIHLHTCAHHHGEHDHSHEEDPHIWLSPENAQMMVKNICLGLIAAYPEYEEIFLRNQDTLLTQLCALQAYGDQALSNLSCRNLITFHDGFHYFAEAFDLTILDSVEEESGSEASASELINLINTVQTNRLPAVFIEENGSSSAAQIISAETGVKIYTLNTAMSGDDYFSVMYQNINTIKEALG